MKPIQVAVLATCCVGLFAGVGCQDAASTPTAPDSSLVSTSGEISYEASGAIKVDSNCGGSGLCNDKDREDNTIYPGGPAVVWIVDGSGTINSYTQCVYYLSNNGTEWLQSSFSGETICGPKLRGFYFAAPSSSFRTEGTVTIEVRCNNIHVGSDSYRSFPAAIGGSCFK